MNKERILTLADLIEQQPHTGYRDDNGFNVYSYFHSCGTPSCIAGWTMHLCGIPSDREIAAIDSYTWEFDTASRQLDLSDEQAERLFLAKDTDLELSEIVPTQAAHTLRHLAEAGEVVWSIAQ